MPQLLDGLEEDPEDLLKRPDEEVGKKLLEELRKPANELKIDYVTVDDLMRNTRKAQNLLNVLYKPKPDYSKFDVLPKDLVTEYLKHVNPQAKDVLSPEELAKEIKLMRPDLKYDDNV